MKQTILLIEDELNIAHGLIFNLEADGFEVIHVETGEEGLKVLAEREVELLVLDLMLPGIDGIEVCREIRRDNERLPILMLTAKAEEYDRIKGLSVGADDYLTKPFSLNEFLLRVKRMLARLNWYKDEKPASLLEFAGNRIDLEEGSAETPNGQITLTDQELKLLRAFAAREGKLVERPELLEAAWGMAPDTETRTLDNFIVRLRKHFEADPSQPQHFLTVRGRGYRFISQP
jgi:two-component system, OmpR family, alkaline phosphatase synthesis response regulator PhoP